MTLSEAIDDLLIRRTQDAGRLDSLATYCVDAFAKEGLPGVRGGKANEVGIRGLGRQKDWDLAYVLAGKPRLLMGEAANVQQLSPEIVIGYVVVMDEYEDSLRRDGMTWIDHFEENLRRIAIRQAPLWNQGLIEGAWLVRINSSKPPASRIANTIDMDAKGITFFRALLEELYRREPTLKKGH
jgi:hypothetical protein